MICVLMKTILTLCGLMLLAGPALAGDDQPTTPKPGSKERTAICDAVRSYSRSEHGVSPKLKFLWKVEWMKVQGRYTPATRTSKAGVPHDPASGGAQGKW